MSIELDSTGGKLSHINEQGQASMVDVADKVVTHRIAVASGVVKMRSATLDLIMLGDAPKGDVLAVARIAGIQAAKKCSDLIPLCHPLALTFVEVTFSSDEASSEIAIQATCKVNGQTGVEMEALTAASVAALTIYDMCKAVDRGMEITQICLSHKSGGKSGSWDKA